MDWDIYPCQKYVVFVYARHNQCFYQTYLNSYSWQFHVDNFILHVEVIMKELDTSERSFYNSEDYIL